MKAMCRVLLPVVLVAVMFTCIANTASASELLIVSALSEDTIAAPGNRLANYITVSVTTADGTPLTGLTAANFKVDAMIVAPGGSMVNITDTRPGRLPGFYILQVTPITTWRAGVYLFAVSVTQGVKYGQALTNVIMD